MEMCRACLSSVDELTKLDNICIENYNLLTNIVVSKADGLPQSMCLTCRDAVNFFATFRSKCIESEASLQQSLGQQFIKDEENTTVPSENREVKLETESFDSLNYEEDFNYDYEDLDNKVKTEIQDNNIDIKLKIPKIKVTKVKKKRKLKASKDTTGKSRKTRSNTSKQGNNNRKLDLYACGLCPSRFKTKPPLTEHLENHIQDMVCRICTEKFFTWEGLLSHRYKHVDEDQMVCHLCERKFCGAVTQENHYLRDHSGKTLGLQCAWCDRVCSSRRQLNKHMLVHTERRFICEHCSKVFNSKSHLATHIGMHSSVKRFVCDQCDKRFTYPNGLLLHRRRHHMHGHYCKICTKVFPEEEALSSHACRKNVVCSVCGKLLQHMGLLKDHMRTHSSERPFKCDTCSASYKSRSALAVHRNRHEGRRPWRCAHCAAAFYSQPVLIKHTRIHTGEKPYVCKTCGKAFTGGHNLKVHMKVHGEMLVVSRKEEQVQNLL